jgi:hypothetical protein
MACSFSLSNFLVFTSILVCKITSKKTIEIRMALYIKKWDEFAGESEIVPENILLAIVNTLITYTLKYVRNKNHIR